MSFVGLAIVATVILVILAAIGTLTWVPAIIAAAVAVGLLLLAKSA